MREPSIVSLVPCLTETTAALGCVRQLVGVTRYCVEPTALPPEVRRLGGTRDPDCAAIKRLAPNLILLDHDENRAEDAAVLAATSDLLVASITKVADVPPFLSTLGARLGAGQTAEALAEEIQALLRRARPVPERRAIVLLWPDPIVVAGPKTYLADVLRHAGVEVIGFGDARYPRPSLGELQAARADLLFLPDEPYRFSESDGHAWAARLAAGPRAVAPRPVLVDGRTLSWYGARTKTALRSGWF